MDGGTFKQNNWNSATKKHYLDYSRHMRDAKTSTALAEKRLSKSFSDTDAIGHRSRAASDSYISGRRRQTTGSLDLAEWTSQPKIFNLDPKFHLKYGNKCKQIEKAEETNTSTSLPASKKANSVNSIYCYGNEDTRSFCDSVSSIACSNVTNAEQHVDRNSVGRKKDDLSNKICKLDGIENWLQNLPTPVL